MSIWAETELTQAAAFCMAAHSATGQLRKYTHEPYWHHPVEVAQIIIMYAPGVSIEVLQAALLHDVVEDTKITLDDIAEWFGHDVAALVGGVTDISRPEDGNRATRKELDRQHIAAASPDAKTIKLADLISNARSIAQHDPQFAKVYMAEKRLLLEVLTEGHPALYAMAEQIVSDYEKAQTQAAPAREVRS